MNFSKERLVIFALSLAFIAMSLMYFQSQIMIKKMYTSSVIKSLESDFSSNAFVVFNETASTTVPDQPATTTPIVPVEPIVSSPLPDTTCYRGGCSGQLCGDESIKDVATTCEWREEYACYAEPIGICERQSTGQCGWTQTEELKSCLMNSNTSTETESVNTPQIEVI